VTAPTKFRVVRFGVQKGHQPVSHIEYWDQDDDDGKGSWRRLSFHMTDAMADGIAAKLNATEPLFVACERFIAYYNQHGVHLLGNGQARRSHEEIRDALNLAKGGAR
jgi:hypothetical protein